MMKLIHKKKQITFLATLLIGLLWTLSDVNVVNAGICAVGYGINGRTCGADQPPPEFAPPAPPEESLLARRTYAFLADFSYIYPEPSTATEPVRNAGEGFFYVTVQAQLVNEIGETWYRINPGEYVRDENLRLVETSEFTGMVVNIQPERPFGWILARVRPSSQPGAEPNENFSFLERYAFFQVFSATEADDGWIWYNIGGNKWIRQTYVGLIDVNPRPEGVGKNEYWTEVDLYEQTFAAYEGDRMVYASLISSGLNRWPTREGLFQVWDRWDETKMSGAEGKVDYYFIEDVPHTMYFDRRLGIALHGAYWHDRFGYKHSHGCVNMPVLAAEWTFLWSQNASNDLWVWVHTSDPSTLLSQTAESGEG